MLIEKFSKKIRYYYNIFYTSKNRRIILVLIDLLIINFAFTFLYPNNPIYFSGNFLNKIIILSSWIIIYIFTGQYKSITSFIGSKSIYLILSVFLGLVFYLLAAYLIKAFKFEDIKLKY